MWAGHIDKPELVSAARYIQRSVVSTGFSVSVAFTIHIMHSCYHQRRCNVIRRNRVTWHPPPGLVTLCPAHCKIFLAVHTFGSDLWVGQIFHSGYTDQTIFIARQHAIHAERDIVFEHQSVRPSDFHTVSKRMHISSNSFHFLVGHDPSFFSTIDVTRETP